MMQFHNTNNHYRGWTLVERGRFCFANRDGTNVYRRVCRANEDESMRLRAFRAVVDREEVADGR